MKSVYLRNFVATATLVTISFLLTTIAFIGIARSYVINDYQTTMESSAEEVCHLASAVADYDGLHSWSLSMSISSIAHSTGNHIFLTDESGEIVCCSDKSPSCEHIGIRLPETVIEQLSENGRMVVLVKPQFEAGKEKVGKKGVVRDRKVHLEVLEQFLRHAEECDFPAEINGGCH